MSRRNDRRDDSCRGLPCTGLIRTIQNERGVSFTVSYVITLAITTLLVAGVLLTAGQVVSDQRSGTVRDQATVVGDKVAASVMAADRLAEQYPDRTSVVTVTVDLPARFVGEPYRIELTDDSEPAVVVWTEEPSVHVRMPLRSDTPIEQTTVTGGSVQVVYLPSEDALALQEVDR